MFNSENKSEYMKQLETFLGQQASCWFTNILCKFVCFIVYLINIWTQCSACNMLVAWQNIVFLCWKTIVYESPCFRMIVFFFCPLAGLKQWLSCVVCKVLVTQWGTNWGWKAQSKVSISMLHYWYACAYVVAHLGLLYKR